MSSDAELASLAEARLDGELDDAAWAAAAARHGAGLDAALARAEARRQAVAGMERPALPSGFAQRLAEDIHRPRRAGGERIIWLGLPLLAAAAGFLAWILVPQTPPVQTLSEREREQLRERSAHAEPPPLLATGVEHRLTEARPPGSQATIDLAEPPDEAAFAALVAAAEAWRREHPDVQATAPEPQVLTQALVALLRARGFVPEADAQAGMEMTVGIIHAGPAPELVCQIEALGAEPVHGLDALRLHLVYCDGGGAVLGTVPFPPPPAATATREQPLFWQVPLAGELRPPIGAATVQLAGQSGRSEALPLVP